MPKLTDQQIYLLGAEILPFGRNIRSKTVENDLKVGEDSNVEFTAFIHDGIENHKPRHNYVELTIEEIEELRKERRFKEKCFLWVIYEGSIKIIREMTRNVLRTHDPNCVCHTNITGCKPGHCGGEMFFGVDGNVYINYYSDRYGNPSDDQWRVIKEYIESVGYRPLIDLTPNP